MYGTGIDDSDNEYIVGLGFVVQCDRSRYHSSRGINRKLGSVGTWSVQVALLLQPRVAFQDHHYTDSTPSAWLTHSVSINFQDVFRRLNGCNRSSRSFIINFIKLVIHGAVFFIRKISSQIHSIHSYKPSA